MPYKEFNKRAHEGLINEPLQQAMARGRIGFIDGRKKTVEAIPNFAAMQDSTRDMRNRMLKDLDVYLVQFEQQVIANGGRVHWAETAEDMQRIVVDLCQQNSVWKLTKGKSMISEEVCLNEALEKAGIEPWETDLGEYIIQLAGERPSHLIGPALHKTKEQVVELFRRAHQLGERELETVESIVSEARQVIRQRYLDADAGITGANMLIAETGTAVLVSNEGNIDLTARLPKLHIVTASIEKIVPTWEDASRQIRLLSRSATGQTITSYTSFFSGPRRSDELDGPEVYHVVLLDNRRSEMLGGDFRDMLRCIRCGACMNHCPVYQNVGGHTYDSVYPGPMGAVLTPLLRNEPADYALPNASSFCGRCETVCPVRIPLVSLLRKLREKEQKELKPQAVARFLTQSFIWLARHPRLYRWFTGFGVKFFKIFALGKERIHRLPLASGWTRFRDLPAPQGKTFQEQWKQNQKRK